MRWFELAMLTSSIGQVALLAIISGRLLTLVAVLEDKR